MSSFDELGLSPAMLEAVKLLGYTEPTAVQQKAIPAILAGRDVVAGAKTGTGKTAAFSLPGLDMIEPGEKHSAPQMLIVTPTRELAQQIAEVCNSISTVTGHRVLSIVGGVSQRPQVKKLGQGTDVLIATPGRLLDLINQGFVDLAQIRLFVLDEADRMLDMGFAPDIRRISEFLPKEHQTLLFSATIDDAVEKSIGSLMVKPLRVEVARLGDVADTVKQSLIRVPQNLKQSLLLALLRERGSKRVIVFARTRGRTDVCARKLCRAGIPAAAIHSDRSQAQRQKALASFEDGSVDVLVGTDVLARGIDVDNVSYVVNFDLPMEAQDYIHRIGRTGRAGASGEAISFVSPDNKRILKDIQRLIKQQIPEITLESFDLEKAQEQAVEAAAGSDPEVIAAEKEVRRRKQRKEKAKERKGLETQAKHQSQKKKQKDEAAADGNGKFVEAKNDGGKNGKAKKDSAVNAFMKTQKRKEAVAAAEEAAIASAPAAGASEGANIAEPAGRTRGKGERGGGERTSDDRGTRERGANSRTKGERTSKSEFFKSGKSSWRSAGRKRSEGRDEFEKKNRSKRRGSDRFASEHDAPKQKRSSATRGNDTFKKKKKRVSSGETASKPRQKNTGAKTRGQKTFSSAPRKQSRKNTGKKTRSR